MKKIALAAAALALSTTANAAVFDNGSFESASANPGSFTTLGTGSTAISGWVVVNGNIDYIGSYWQAGADSRSIDLSGGVPGAIAQTFDTVFGQQYEVSFLLSGNPDGPPPVKTLRVEATGTAYQDYAFATAGHSLASMGWTAYTYAFTATGSSTTLTFSNASVASAYGPAIDGVSVTAVPEPASWAMMIGGFAIAGAAMRRRAARTTFNMA